LISAAEAAASRQITLARIRKNRMHSSFVSRKGLVWTVRASLLALRVRQLSLSDECTRPSQGYPVTGCEFPRLQLRGSAGFSPASLLK